MLQTCRSFKCCKGCQLSVLTSVLQMLQCFPGVAGLQYLQMLQYCRSLKMLLECCRVPFFGGKLQMLQEKNCLQMLQSLQMLQCFQCCGVSSDLKNCCRCCGAFKACRVLQCEILDFFSDMSFALRCLAPSSLGT